jgi:hypothetical protein
MSFWKKNKLIEYDPKTLDLEKLSVLQKSLIAKLLLVNNELIKRYTTLIELSKGMADMEDGRKIFADDVARLIRLNMVLEDELARVLKPAGSNDFSN